MKNPENRKERIELAGRLRQIRESAGYTQEQFSELLDISTSGYKKIESAKNQITLDEIRKLEKHFHVSADYLLFGKNSDFEETWKLIENSSESCKMQFLFRLLFYFINAKQKVFLDKESEKTIQEKIMELLKSY